MGLNTSGAPVPPSEMEERMDKTTMTRRAVVRTAALATAALATPLVRAARAAENVVPGGSMTLAWHTNITPRWLDPLLHDKTDGVEIVDERTLRFDFKGPFLDFPRLIGTANVSGAGWVVPAKYYEEVGPDGFAQKPIGAGPYRLVSQQPGTRIEFEAFEDYYRPVHIKRFTIVAVPEAATRVAMIERGEADIMYFVSGELIDRVKNNPKLMLAPVVSGSRWLEFPGFQ